MTQTQTAHNHIEFIEPLTKTLPMILDLAPLAHVNVEHFCGTMTHDARPEATLLTDLTDLSALEDLEDLADGLQGYIDYTEQGVESLIPLRLRDRNGE